MPKLQLTDIALKSLNPPEKGQETYWDNRLAGFGCRVSQGGQKTFIVMHGPREARRRKVVGKYPLTSLKDAREEAKKLLAGLTLGVVEEAPKRSISFTEARERFLEQAQQRVRPRTAQDYKRLLNRHFAFKGKKLTDITKQDIQTSLSKLVKTPSEHHHA